MLAIERRSEIMTLIQRDRSVRVNELADKFQVTEETIRRDLDKLEKEGKVKKTYGGAVVQDLVSEDASFLDRQQKNMTQKRRIAAYADDLIQEGETIFIDMSTTALEVIKQLSPLKHITVITNSLNAMVELSQRSNINLIALGGAFNEGALSMVGPMTTKSIDHYYADKTLFSVRGISLQKGIMDSKEELAEIKRHMIENAKEVILLADESKFNQAALVQVVPMTSIDRVVTEYELNQEWRAYFEEMGVEALVVR